MDRRNFLKSSAITAAGLGLTPMMGRSFSSVYGESAPGNKIKIGLIGCRNQGWSNLKTFLQYPGTECIALCDIDDQWLYQRAADLEQMTGKKPPQLVKDWRRVIDNKDVDMVIIGTPDHWHCLQLVAACEAGKDVYVEKPLANTIEECDLMVRAARKYNRIVQVGQWQRSDPHWDEAAAYVQSGNLGVCEQSRCGHTRQQMTLRLWRLTLLREWITTCGWVLHRRELSIKTCSTIISVFSGIMRGD